MNDFQIRPAHRCDLDQLARTILVAQVSGGTLVGFVEVDLRSHADGCNPAQAVGYIEGW